jgi:DNA repair protein RecO (recombination protein O)
VRDEEGRGFVLRTWPLREADAIVSIFTLEHGKVRGVAHRARRPKSPWLGALEPLTEIDIHWRRREGQDLVSLRDVSIVRSPYPAKPDLGLIWTLAYLADLFEAIGQEGDEDETLYRLVGTLVDAAQAGAARSVLARYAEAWALRLTGVLPDFSRCASCGASLRAEGGTWQWRLSGLACSACAGPAAADPAVLAADLLFLEEIRRRPPAEVASPEPAVARRVRALLGQVLRELLGRELKSARFLDELERVERP